MGMKLDIFVIMSDNTRAKVSTKPQRDLFINQIHSLSRVFKHKKPLGDNDFKTVD